MKTQVMAVVMFCTVALPQLASGSMSCSEIFDGTHPINGSYTVRDTKIDFDSLIHLDGTVTILAGSKSNLGDRGETLLTSEELKINAAGEKVALKILAIPAVNGSNHILDYSNLLEINLAFEPGKGLMGGTVKAKRAAQFLLAYEINPTVLLKNAGFVSPRKVSNSDKFIAEIDENGNGTLLVWFTKESIPNYSNFAESMKDYGGYARTLKLKIENGAIKGPVGN